MTITNPISKIKDPIKKAQVTALCKGLQILNKDGTKDINEVLQTLNLPIAIHMFITGNFSELMSLNYN
jgi:hypothetical protein